MFHKDVNCFCDWIPILIKSDTNSNLSSVTAFMYPSDWGIAARQSMHGWLLASAQIADEYPTGTARSPVQTSSEMMKYVDREAVKEVMVEMPKEVSKYVDREVVKEVSMYVDREVPKHVIVEVVKDVIKNMDREIVKEVMVEIARLERLRDVYQQFDLNGNGTVSFHEMLALGRARRKLCHKVGEWTIDDNENLMRDIGVDKAGNVTIHRFVSFFNTSLPSDVDEFEENVQQFLQCARYLRNQADTQADGTGNDEVSTKGRVGR